MRFEEPGIGKGIPGKIGKNLLTNVYPAEIRAACFKGAAVTGF